MTLRSSDLQSDGDQDSIRNSCDVFKLKKQEEELRGLIVIYSGPFDQLSPNHRICLHPLSDILIFGHTTSNWKTLSQVDDELYIYKKRNVQGVPK